MRRRQPRRRSQARVRLPLWAVAALSVVALILVAATSLWLFRTVQGLVAAADLSDPDFGPVQERPVDDPAEPAQPAVTLAAGGQPLPDVALEPWTGTERVTILMLGIDVRCDEEGPTRTDSIMLVSADPLSNSASVLSLPRDLWVEIPGFGVDRINQAYYLGELYEYPGGGQALAVETVEAILGVPIDHYVTVDFNAFVEIVDLIGGIEIDVPEAIDDPNYPDNCYGYDPFFISAGRQRLDGAAALKYARTRATFGGDVDRAQRQQQVVLAARDQVLQLNMLPQLVVQAPQILLSLQQNVETSIPVDEAVKLASLAQDIPAGNVRTAVLDFDYVYNETTPDGRQVLVPIRENIRALREELFTAPVAPTPNIESLPSLMAAENARVAVYNGTSEFGLAGNTQSYLQGLNVNVTEIGNADSAGYTSTQIIDFGQHPSTVLYLIQQMQIPPLNSSSGTRPDGEYDILVILGSDWSVPESGT